MALLAIATAQPTSVKGLTGSSIAVTKLQVKPSRLSFKPTNNSAIEGAPTLFSPRPQSAAALYRGRPLGLSYRKQVRPRRPAGIKFGCGRIRGDMGDFRLPQFIVVKPLIKKLSGHNAYYKKNEDGSHGGGLALGSEAEYSVFSPLVKIEAERAKIDKKYVNLRFCHSNMYWQRRSNSNNIAAVSTKPNEDKSDNSCTLFEPHPMSDPSNGFYLKHVNTGMSLAIDETSNFTLVHVSAPNDSNYLTFVDWETLVQLPERVAFKGDNGSYLKVYNADEGGATVRHLQYGEKDANTPLSGHTVYQEPDGHVRIRSDYNNKYWQWGAHSDWVLANDVSGNANNSVLFWPIKIDANTIALRSKGNGKFCRRLTNETGRTDFLSATAGTITAEAKIQVEELVMDRKICHVDYKMEHARIFDEQPYLAGSCLLVNATDNKTSESVTITYQDQKSHSFTRGVSITGGVITVIKTGIPFIVDGTIQISFDVIGNFEWDTTTTNTSSVAATGTVEVPPMSSVLVEYVGTKGACDIPFSYTQVDKSSTDGKIKCDEKIDGTYTGVSCYNFSFKMSAPKAVI